MHVLVVETKFPAQQLLLLSQAPTQASRVVAVETISGVNVVPELFKDF